MINNKVFVITDNLYLYSRFRKMVSNINSIKLEDFSFFHSINNLSFKQEEGIKSISIKENLDFIINNFSIVLSIHCKQFFPKKLVNSIKCINVHPGYNPNNRGWFPQVFSILNDEVIGATIHIIDEKLDHGPIIARREVDKHIWDTSKTIYDRVIEAELILLKEYLPIILEGKYDLLLPEFEGVIHKKDV